MKIQFNLTTSSEDLDRYESRAALEDMMRGFDGVELMQFEDDMRGIIPPDRVVGLHMGYFPCWLDFWQGNWDAVRREFGSLETAYRVYGGRDRSAILNRFRRDLEHARRWGAEYVVFHVSESTFEENFRLEYSHSDEEVIDAAIELLNELFHDVDPDLALLVENLWQPGLSFTRPEMTRRLMDGIKHANRGIMLDTGHLLHTNLDLCSQEDGLSYIHSLLDAHGELCRWIRGMHLNQSITGEIFRQAMENPPAMGSSYEERFGQMFMHAFNVDRHLPFTCEGIDKLVERIAPEYLTFEFITSGRAQHRDFLARQRRALKLDL